MDEEGSETHGDSAGEIREAHDIMRQFKWMVEKEKYYDAKTIAKQTIKIDNCCLFYLSTNRNLASPPNHTRTPHTYHPIPRPRPCFTSPASQASTVLGFLFPLQVDETLMQFGQDDRLKTTVYSTDRPPIRPLARSPRFHPFPCPHLDVDGVIRYP